MRLVAIEGKKARRLETGLERGVEGAVRFPIARSSSRHLLDMGNLISVERVGFNVVQKGRSIHFPL